jgi:hypothetical protein
MLSNAQIDHFATFGFVVLRDVLAEHTGTLRAEVDTAIRPASTSCAEPTATTSSISGSCRRDTA